MRVSVGIGGGSRGRVAPAPRRAAPRRVVAPRGGVHVHMGPRPMMRRRRGVVVMGGPRMRRMRPPGAAMISSAISLICIAIFFTVIGFVLRGSLPEGAANTTFIALIGTAAFFYLLGFLFLFLGIGARRRAGDWRAQQAQMMQQQQMQNQPMPQHVQQQQQPQQRFCPACGTPGNPGQNNCTE